MSFLCTGPPTKYSRAPAAGASAVTAIAAIGTRYLIAWLMLLSFIEFASTPTALRPPLVPIELQFDGPRSQAPPAPPDRRRAAPPSDDRNSPPAHAGRGRECCPGAAARRCPTAGSPSSESNRYRPESPPPGRPSRP